MTQPEKADCYLCRKKNGMRAIKNEGEPLSQETEYQCVSCSTIGQPFSKNQSGGEDMNEETCAAPEDMRCPNCDSDKLHPLNRPSYPLKIRTLWECPECKNFFQPFLGVGLTPTTVWDIHCESCHEHGFINGADSEDENVREDTVWFDDEYESGTIIECVHCHDTYQYGDIRSECETLFPKIPD